MTKGPVRKDGNGDKRGLAIGKGPQEVSHTELCDVEFAFGDHTFEDLSDDGGAIKCRLDTFDFYFAGGEGAGAVVVPESDIEF